MAPLEFQLSRGAVASSPRLAGPHCAFQLAQTSTSGDLWAKASLGSRPSDSSRLIETSSLSNHLDSSPPSVPVGAKAFTQNLTPAPYEPAKINRSSRCLPLLRQSYAQSLLRFPRCQEACGGMGSRTGTYHIVEYEQSIQQFFDLCSWGNRACKVSKPEGNSAGCLASWASEAGAQ